MAKKAKKEAVKPEQSKERMAKAKYHAQKAAKKARAVTPAAGANVATAAPPAIVPPAKKERKPHYVREKKAEPPKSPAVVLPPRSTTFTAKIMSKGIVMPPKEEKGMGGMPVG